MSKSVWKVSWKVSRKNILQIKLEQKLFTKSDLAYFAKSPYIIFHFFFYMFSVYSMSKLFFTLPKQVIFYTSRTSKVKHIYGCFSSTYEHWNLVDIQKCINTCIE